MQENINKESTEEELNMVKIEQEEVKPANKKMTILNFAIIVIICAGLLIYMFTVDGIDNIINVLKTVDYRWVVLRTSMFIFTLVL